MIRRVLTLMLLLGLGALAGPPGAAGALAETTSTVSTTEAQTAPAPTTAPVPTGTTPAPAGPPGPVTTPATTTTEVKAPPAPEVRRQRSQPRTIVHVPSSHTPEGASQQPSKLAPSTNAASGGLTPPLPSTLSGSVSGVGSFFINSFSIPPFLLPIYQAAGAAYGIPWQVLAAINEVETDYGRDLSVSSAGAEGWMQFMPETWLSYGVDVNNSGFEDPYNPADAIFAAARYLKAAGGERDIRAAVFAYNHSQAYVNSVMLRARLLGGTPPELLSAVTALTEARFPVHAPSHYSDGFPTTEESPPRTVPGTTIYSQAGAPVIAVQDGRIVQISQAGPLGRSIQLRDAYGNTYTYAELGTLASLYPVLEARGVHGVSTAPATAAAGVFRAGPENVYLHPLRVGVQVIAGTVLGHVGAASAPHIVFQIRPAGTEAPLIDPKPILDGWVKRGATSVIRSKGRDPLTTISPTAGQALLESKTQLELQVMRDGSIRLPGCERRRIGDGRVDRRVLAVLEFLSASGLEPTVSSRSCAAASPARPVLAPPSASVDISAVNGVPISRRRGPGSIAEILERRLLGLQGVMKPLRVATSTGASPVAGALAPGARALDIDIEFKGLGGEGARLALVPRGGLSPSQWISLVARLGQIPDAPVSAKPSPASIPDNPSPPPPAAGKGR